MYESYFGFSSKPFELVPNPEFLYPSASHRQALSYLQYGLKEQAGFILLTGEVGSGKTTILRRMIRKLDKDTVLAHIFNTHANPEQLLRLIIDEFGIQSPDEDGKAGMLRDLNDFLLAKYAQKIQPIVIVDEAQNLSMEALEELRLLSNLETEDRKLIHIVLSGQPELKRMLSRPELRQLRQRISISCHLAPLGFEDTCKYILFRMEKAGNREAVRFDDGVMELIYQFSGGIPRLINIYCDYLLLTAFSDESPMINLKTAHEVINELAQDLGNRKAELDAAEAKPSVLPEPVERANTQMTDREFLLDTNRRLVQLLGLIEEQNVTLGQQLSASEEKLMTEVKHIQERLKTMGNLLVRVGDRLDRY